MHMQKEKMWMPVFFIGGSGGIGFFLKHINTLDKLNTRIHGVVISMDSSSYHSVIVGKAPI
jgi:hypothetical protein